MVVAVNALRYMAELEAENFVTRRLAVREGLLGSCCWTLHMCGTNRYMSAAKVALLVPNVWSWISSTAA